MCGIDGPVVGIVAEAMRYIHSVCETPRLKGEKVLQSTR